MRKTASATTCILAVGFVVLFSGFASATVPTAMNFQGRLADNTGSPVADGDHSVVFTIYDNAVAGNSKWTETRTITTADGLFAVLLGSVNPLVDTVFNADVRYLGIKVESDAEMSPRTALVTVPFAYHAATADSAQFANSAATADSAEFAAFAATADTAEFATAAISHGGWTDDGTVIRLTTSTDSVGIGTSTPTAKLEVNGVLRVTDKAVLGPSEAWGLQSFAAGAGNVAYAMYSTVGGGFGNHNHGESAVISGGKANDISSQSPYAVIGGGLENRVNAPFTTIAGGGWYLPGDSANFALDTGATVGGGMSNRATGLGSHVGGGVYNTASGRGAVVCGGGGADGYFGFVDSNWAEGDFSFVGGGFGNDNRGDFSCIVSGRWNEITYDLDTASLIVGGTGNTIFGKHSIIVGGRNNEISAFDGSGDIREGFATIVGGLSNKVRAGHGYIGAGNANTIDSIGAWSAILSGSDCYTSDTGCVIAGGVSDSCWGQLGTISGGERNTISATGYAGVIGGGSNNRVDGVHSVVPGGAFNIATGGMSFAAGYYANALHVGSFVWSDASATVFASSAMNEFNVRAAGGIRMYSSPTLLSGVQLFPGSSAWSAVSDSTVKENIRPVNGDEILRKLSELEISQWNYETQDASIQHIGPMAQDFYRLFELGEDNRHINSLDPDGVSLAAIKALIEKNERLETELAELKAVVKTLIDSQVR